MATSKKTTELKDQFSQIPEINEPITEETIQLLNEYCSFFETRNGHSEALNTYLLGVTPIYFTDMDRSLFFDIFGHVSEKKLKDALNHVSGIDKSWVVLNDVYNHLSVYEIYRIFTSDLDDNLKEQGAMSILKMLHYKFFTSLVFHYFRFGANKNVMESVVKNMSAKYDIIKYGTWKKVIEVTCEDVLAVNSVHSQALRKYIYDVDDMKVITDVQTRIRQKIKLVNGLYREAKENQDEIGSYGLVDEIDGEKVITSESNIFDSIISNMLQQIQVQSRFIDDELIHIISLKFNNVNDSTFRSILTTFSTTAAVQANSGDFNKESEVDDPFNEGEKIVIYEGLGILVQEMLQKSYRYCTVNRVDMKSKNAILTKVSNLFSSSRILDEDIIKIKKSFLVFVNSCGKSTRAATIASLAIALIIYILVRSFDYLN